MSTSAAERKRVWGFPLNWTGFWIIFGLAEVLLVIATGAKQVWLYIAGLVVGGVGAFVCSLAAMGVGIALTLAFGAVCGLIILWLVLILLWGAADSGGGFWDNFYF